jgi:hypothetical protein
LYCWGGVGVGISAVDVHAVDAILVDALYKTNVSARGLLTQNPTHVYSVGVKADMGGTKDRPIPVRHHKVVAVG